MHVRVGLWRRLSVEELMLLNCGVGEDSWESLGLQGDPTSPFTGDQPWDFFGRNYANTETPVLWPPHAKSWLIGKDSDAGRDWGQEEKGMIEDEMAWWHHWLDGRESEWTLGVGDGQGGLACCDSWGHKESDMTEQLNWTELIINTVCDTCFADFFILSHILTLFNFGLFLEIAFLYIAFFMLCWKCSHIYTHNYLKFNLNRSLSSLKLV